MKKLLTFLSGKKSVIATVLMGAVAYMASLQYIGEAEVAFLTIIVGALFGGASYATKKIVYNKK